MAIVYRHRNPTNYEVFYVGIGKCDSGKRAYEKNRSRYWKNYVNKYGDPLIEILATNICYEEAKELEVLLIEQYGRKDLGKGNLLNLTDGGDGTLGNIHSNETKNKISNSLKGVKHSLERRNKLSKANLGKVLSKETIIKIKQSSPNKKCVIDNNTGKIYNSIRSAARDFNISYGYLANMLKGFRKNKTTLSLLSN